jgi:hypothetical protein
MQAMDDPDVGNSILLKASEQTLSPKRISSPLTRGLAILRLKQSSSYELSTARLEIDKTNLPRRCGSSSQAITAKSRPDSRSILILYNNTSDADGRMQE